MRDFSDFEKRLIRKILEIFSIPGGLSVLGNILDYELDPNIYIEVKSNSDCPIMIKRDYWEEITNKYSTIGLSELIKSIESKLLLTLMLIAYLEKERLILLTGELDLQYLGEKESSSEYNEYQLKDKKLKDLLYNYSRKKITPVEGLKKLVDNNFKSDEEIRIERQFELNRKSFYWTAASVMIAGIALIVSIINPFNQPQKLIIDKEILHFIKSLERKTDSAYILNHENNVSLDSMIKKN